MYSLTLYVVENGVPTESTSFRNTIPELHDFIKDKLPSDFQSEDTIRNSLKNKQLYLRGGLSLKGQPTFVVVTNLPT